MTREEKQLLLTDLCARLPYGVKFLRESWNYEWDQELSVIEVLEDIDNEGYINHTRVYKVWDIKPYLRPMSSMTEEERKIQKGYIYHFTKDNLPDYEGDFVFEDEVYEYIDWLNAHHFDYRGLIEKGLAIEAPDGMYKVEE